LSSTKSTQERKIGIQRGYVEKKTKIADGWAQEGTERQRKRNKSINWWKVTRERNYRKGEGLK